MFVYKKTRMQSDGTESMAPPQINMKKLQYSKRNKHSRNSSAGDLDGDFDFTGKFHSLPSRTNVRIEMLRTLNTRVQL